MSGGLPGRSVSHTHANRQSRRHEIARSGDGASTAPRKAEPRPQSAVTAAFQECGTFLKKFLAGFLPVRPGGAPSPLTLVPYYAWNNRGDQSMIVWVPARKSEKLAYETRNSRTADSAC